MKPNLALSFLALGWPVAASFAQNPAPKTGVPSSKAAHKTPKSAPKTRSSAQLAPRGDAPNDPVAAAILNAERNQDANSLLLLYGQAVTDSELARAAISQLLASYYQMRNGAQTAEQATQAVAEANLRFQVLQAAQNQIMVQQNQQLLQQNAQIIALLQQQARPR